MVAHSQLSYKVDLTMKWTPKNDSLNEIYLKNSIKQHLHDDSKCQMAGLEIGLEPGTLKSELARNSDHWNGNWVSWTRIQYWVLQCQVHVKIIW